MSRRELAALAPRRAQWMAKRVSALTLRTSVDVAAAAWACEMTALELAAEKMPDRKIAWIDFDEMLADMPGELGKAADFLGFAAPPSRIDEIANGPLMTRYSKATEYEYSPALRSEVIAEAEAANRADIDSALAMLQSAAETSPLLARALDRAKEC
jgi:hypothetical protein